MAVFTKTRKQVRIEKAIYKKYLNKKDKIRYTAFKRLQIVTPNILFTIEDAIKELKKENEELQDMLAWVINLSPHQYLKCQVEAYKIINKNKKKRIKN